jgi:transcriptional regulator with PAS, ATPase and Fis domain
MHEWIKEFPAAITVCDLNGIITEMNDKAISTFAKDGGADLIGKNLYDYHPAHCNEIIRTMIATGEPHTYTIEKQGVKKLIYQQPWFMDGKVAGVVEMSFIIPLDMPHYVRS